MPIFLRISENRLSAATISFEFIVLPFERVISALEELVLRESTAMSKMTSGTRDFQGNRIVDVLGLR